MDELFLRAYAKINPGLDVLGKREDGYHEVRMIMQTVRLYDKILLKKKEEPGFVIETNLGFLPVNEDNLMYRAAELLFEAFGLPGGLYMKLSKYIPVSAGLGGGSSDAAAVLFGINRMYELGLTQEELEKFGVKIGADVPFCIRRGTALSEGIGEKLTTLPAFPKCYVVLAKPGVSVSTKAVYQKLDETPVPVHPDIDGMKEALKGGDLKGITDRMANVLEYVTIPMHPGIGTIKEFLMNAGAMNALMSGSGPTVFGIFDNLDDAKKAVFGLRRTRLASSVLIADMY